MQSIIIFYLIISSSLLVVAKENLADDTVIKFTSIEWKQLNIIIATPSQPVHPPEVIANFEESKKNPIVDKGRIIGFPVEPAIDGTKVRLELSNQPGQSLQIKKKLISQLLAEGNEDAKALQSLIILLIPSKKIEDLGYPLIELSGDRDTILKKLSSDDLLDWLTLVNNSSTMKPIKMPKSQ